MKKRIAVFTNGFSNEYIQHVIEGLKNKAKIDGVDIFTFVTYCSAIDDTRQNECQLNIFKLANPNYFDGAIMLTNTFNTKEEQELIYSRIGNTDYPIVSLEVDFPNASCIKSENYKGAYDLAEHLIEVHNVKRIVYVSGVKENPENTIRKQALLDVLSKHNLELDDEIEADFSFFNPYSQILQKLDNGYVLPDAFVCANDIMALGINTALTNAGYSVPADVIITGFDHIEDGQYTFPILASVSRGWEKFGELAYDRLMWQIQHPNEHITDTYDSLFIPSESCGCQPTKESIEFRNHKIRNMYFSTIQASITDIFFQRLRLSLSNAEHKEHFFEKGKSILNYRRIISDNFCICTEPAFFEMEDSEYPRKITEFSKTMDVLYECRNEEDIPLHTFDRSELYPGYKHIEGESNHYIFAAFNYNDYLIGYIAIKNNEQMLYNQTFRNWIMNMNTIFFNMRRYIFAQRNNRQLRKIYMTDALTGMYNRTGCETVLYEFIITQKQEGKKTILAFADIDRMKTINDVYGHLNGDLAIKATADAFRKYTPNEWIFGRYGGDEFIAVGPYNSEEDINAFINTLSESMSSYFEMLNLSFMLHASIGYTIIREDDDSSIDTFIKRADESMYKEKEKMHEILDAMHK